MAQDMPGTQPDLADTLPAGDVGVAAAETAAIEGDQPAKQGQPDAALGSQATDSAKAAEIGKETCCKCQQLCAKDDMIYRPSFKKELRWNCKPCNALLVQMQRHGIPLKDVLSEEDTLAFFQEAAQERRNASDGRLQFSSARALLKRQMLQISKKSYRDGKDGEWHPLAFWELRGYDIDAIRRLAPCEKHEVLGDTYKVSIHHQSEESLQEEIEQRLTSMESLARARRQGQNAPPSENVNMDLELTEPERLRNLKRGMPKTEEEKEAAKQARIAEKTADKERKLATAAAAKLLPGLQSVAERLESKVTRMGTTYDFMSAECETKQEVEAAREELKEAIKAATQLLDKAAKGGKCDIGDLRWKKDKEWQSVQRTGNAALRSLNEASRAAPRPKAKAKAKAGAKQ